MQPEHTPTMAIFVLPSLRNSWFMMTFAVVKGAASRIHVA